MTKKDWGKVTPTPTDIATDTATKTKRYWEWRGGVDAIIAAVPPFAMFSRAEYRSATALLKNAIQEKANCNILHVACGVKSLELAGVNAAAMILLDRSHAMLRHAALRNPQATLLCADTSALPFQNETFDGIVAIGISEYIGEPLAWLLELKRCLRPGGALILSIAPDHWRNRIRKLWNRELWLREQKEWFEYFRQSGFQVVETSELLLQVQFRCT